MKNIPNGLESYRKSSREAYNNGWCLKRNQQCSYQKKLHCVMGAMTALENEMNVIWDKVSKNISKEYIYILTEFRTSLMIKIKNRAQACFDGKETIHQGNRVFITDHVKSAFCELISRIPNVSVTPEKELKLKAEFEPLLKRAKKIDIQLDTTRGDFTVFFELKLGTFNDIGAAIFEANIIDRRKNDEFVVLTRGWNDIKIYQKYRDVIIKNFRETITEVLNLDMLDDDSIRILTDYYDRISKICEQGNTD